MSNASSAIELQTPGVADIGDSDDTVRNGGHDEEHQLQSLPPVDGGFDAYAFLVGAFFIDALVWGYPFSFGTFNDFYIKQPQFAGATGIASIGTSCSGFMYLGAPFIFTMMEAFPQYQRKCSIIGLLLCIISMILASFANTVGQLIVTQGVLFAIGGSLVYSPAFLYLDQWFVRKKGLAYGVMWAGAGASGVVMPLVFNAALEKYGYRTVHRGFAVAIMVLAAPLLYYLKPRVPVAATHTRRRISTKFLISPVFFFLQLGNIIESVGYFLPGLYLPVHASSLSISGSKGSLLVSLLNLAAVFGQIFLGGLSDHVHITTVYMVSAIGTALAVFLAWGLANSMAPLVVFAILYGFFAGGFSSTFAGCTKEIRKKYPASEQGLVCGMFFAGRGVGNVICGPLSEALIRGGGKGWNGAGAYGTKFGIMVVVTGVTAVASTIAVAARRVKM